MVVDELHCCPHNKIYCRNWLMVPIHQPGFNQCVPHLPSVADTYRAAISVYCFVCMQISVDIRRHYGQYDHGTATAIRMGILINGNV